MTLARYAKCLRYKRHSVDVPLLWAFLIFQFAGIAFLPAGLAADSNRLAPLLSTAISGDSCSFLCNYDFEEKEFIKPGQFAFVHQSLFPCWRTTASDEKIEIWGSGFGGVPAFSGNYFIELNANMVSTLYQDFTAMPGSMAWVSFAHRGRAGTDVMSVELGPVGGPYTLLGTYSAGNKAWEYHTLTFTFPQNKGTNYSLRFKSVSAAGGATVGNFLDAISIELPRPALTTNILHPHCSMTHDGSIAIDVTSGSPPYNFTWSLPTLGDTSLADGLRPGIYMVTVTDFFGCSVRDSIALVPNDNPITNFISETLCQGDSIVFGKMTIHEPGHYSDTLKSYQGCDSIVGLQVEVVQPTSFHEKLSVCGSFSWNGQIYHQSGTYMFQSQGYLGCDSITYLDLTIHKTSIEYDTIQSCQSYTWPVTGETLTEGGLYEAVLVNAEGCDSAIILDLKISNPDTLLIEASACDTYFWPASGETYTEDGRHMIITQNYQGCDSIMILDLDINYPSGKVIELEVCDKYKWTLDQNTYTHSGNYFYTLTNAAGCDSIITLALTVHPIYNKADTINALGTYFWPASGKTYTESGTYPLYLSDDNGCDSILILHLDILPRPTLYIPNAFSPDGDGINDRFSVYTNPHVKKINNISIFDRWGNLVFYQEEMTPNNSTEGWDGTFKSKPMDPAVYVYYLEAEMFDGSQWPFKGEIHLVR